MFSILKRVSNTFSSSVHYTPFHPSLSRTRATLAPRFSKIHKVPKGRVHIPTGGSTKGTTLAFGEYGLRVIGNGMRLSAKQLTAADNALKRKIKPIKDAKVWLRTFPSVPVCVKGNETRMGKGKGTFDHWAVRVPIGRVVFEIGGGGLREEIARDALRIAATKLPVLTEFITRAAHPRLGYLDVPRDSVEQSKTHSFAAPPAVSTPTEGVQRAMIDMAPI